MPKFINGKLLSIITYEDSTPISNYPDFLEACAKYDILEFKAYNYNHPIDCLPSNLKYINLAAANYFNHPLNNLPTSLVGISLPRDYNQQLDNLPNGLKYLYFHATRMHWIHFHEKNRNLPSSIEYGCSCLNLYDFTNRKCTSMYGGFHEGALYLHDNFVNNIIYKPNGN
jgi:hypothetical protein